MLRKRHHATSSSLVLAIALAVLGVRPRTADGQERWVRRVDVDAITDDSVRSVSTRSADGYEFAVYRIGRGAVWARFRIPDSVPRVLASDPAPVYRIDNRPPQDLATDVRLQRLVGKPMIALEPKWVNFVLWHGQGQEVGGTLQWLAEGKRLLIRYYIFTGGSKDVSFSLEGFAQELGWLLQLAPAGTPPPSM